MLLDDDEEEEELFLLWLRFVAHLGVDNCLMDVSRDHLASVSFYAGKF